MKKHKSYGFTVVELIVVVVVIAVLASITAIAYRSTQADSRDKKRMADAMILKAAIDDYYADNGSYPSPASNCTSPGYGYSSTSQACWRNEIWELLVSQGYLQKVPTPEMKASYSSVLNVGSNGNTNYAWTQSSASSYGVYIPLENQPDCKFGKSMSTGWYGGAVTCDL